MRRYEDFSVGDVYRSSIGRTVTETDNLLFTALAMNTNELHFNEEAAKATEFGRLLVNSTFTLALTLGLSVRDTTEAGGINLGWKEILLPKPVFIGDTIRSETEVLSVRESGSRPAYGIVEIRTRGVNQRDETVCEFERSFMIPKRS
jgi:itaconyl-CoA hydratase